MTHSKGDASLSRQRKGFTVQASPFNAIKLDLALILIVGAVLLIVHDHLVVNQLGQLGLLAGYGIVAMCWVVIKTRRVEKQLAEAELKSRQESGEDGEK